MKPYLTVLNDRFISISGPDAIKFLQGQCSCDLLSLSEHAFSFGTLNTPKGRMYALFKVIKTEQGLLLSLEQSLLESTLEKLRKYAVFFKCELKETNDYRAYGLIDFPGSSPVLSLSRQTKAFILTLSETQQLHEIWLDSTQTEQDLINLLPQQQTETLELVHAPQDLWYAKETLCGIPALYANTQEEFILQNLNLQQLGAVSFKKGCYTGQEIIARMKFLGKVKKQCFLLKSDARCIAEPKQVILDAQGNKCGTLVRLHWSEQTGSVSLAILNIEDALNYGALYLEGHPDIPFSIFEADYSEFLNQAANKA